MPLVFITDRHGYYQENDVLDATLAVLQEQNLVEEVDGFFYVWENQNEEPISSIGELRDLIVQSEGM